MFGCEDFKKKLVTYCHERLALSALTIEGSYEHCPPEGDRVMKNTRLTSILSSSLIACALTIGSLASTQSVLAQSETVLAAVTIPFSFQAGSQTMPPGTYQIDHDWGALVLLRGPRHATDFVMMHRTSKLRAADHGSVVFDHVGGKYYLRQIWMAQSTDGLECSRSRAEKESLLADNKQSPSSIELAFNSAPQH
jgi:hypothetical protein